MSADRSHDEQPLELTHRTLESPVGPLLVVVTERGVVRVAFDCEGHDEVLDGLEHALGRRARLEPRRSDEMARRLTSYLDGSRRGLDLPVDLRLVRGFRAEVVERLAAVPQGCTWTYSHLAEAVGRPRAVRATASACAHNPVPIVRPCHRIVRKDGDLGGYVGGTDAKSFLLRLEGAVP